MHPDNVRGRGPDISCYRYVWSAARLPSRMRKISCSRGWKEPRTVPGLREQFLRPDHPLRHRHSVWALDYAGRALVASHGLVLGGHAQEVLPAQRELAVAVSVHDEAYHVTHRQTLGALPVALAAHAAKVRTNLFQPGGQDLLVRVGELLRHYAEVLLQLIDVRHARDRGGDRWVLDRPLERGGGESGRPWRRGGAAAPGLSHHLHGHQTHARSEEHTSELQSTCNLVCRHLLDN